MNRDTMLLDGRIMIAASENFKDLPPVPHIVDKVATLSCQVSEYDVVAVVGL